MRERIQIDGQPLSEEKFTRYFFEVWDKLQGETRPVYFRFLTLLAYHAYISEGVDATIIECGIGGAYDSTNILEHPTVTGITSLGIDHVGVLGATLPEIAWHKAGIMKPGSRCYTPRSQAKEAKSVLEQVADEKSVELIYVDTDPDIASGKVPLGLQADFQKTNASLAVSIARDFLTRQGYNSSPTLDDGIRQGLSTVKWPGRCETRHEPGVTWCIDGGHTLESISLAGKWFASYLQRRHETLSSAHCSRFLIFNQQTRDADSLAKALHDTLASSLGDEKPFTHAIFCTNTTFTDTGFRPDLVSVNTNADDVEALKVQKQLAKTWKGIDASTHVEVVRTIEEAVQIVREEADNSNGEGEITALVTGSLHLVGGFLEVLETTRR